MISRESNSETEDEFPAAYICRENGTKQGYTYRMIIGPALQERRFKKTAVSNGRFRCLDLIENGVFGGEDI